MTEQVRWGILSTAGIAQFEVIPAMIRSNNATVTAIASLSGRAQEVAQLFKIEKAFDSYDQLLDDPDIDAVYIPLPNHLHKEWTVKAAKKKKHILCEKPGALTAKDIEEIQQVCHQHQVIYMEGFMYYLHPQHQRVHQLIKTGEIGDIKQFRARFSFHLTDRADNIRMDPSMGGGSLYDIGCYTIHAMRNILGEEPTSVHTEAIIDPTYHVETSAVSFFNFSSGITAILESSFDMFGQDEYEIIGTEGRIKVPRAFRPDNRGGEGIVVLDKGHFVRSESFSNDLYRDEIEHISHAILTKSEPILTIDNTLNNMKVIDACLESISTKQKVAIRR
ncbi:Gfo/Idh/MocA family protein [Amphibacillus sediminis]|uniref:Gfo/Idh/MocA family protein n=1 Tax=Amphibacillus sediminis TaxID=360185 RepID=UPI00082E0BC0|nr:Gfo/Idh/MocA family oxidoreductase [Amphibacillus sediminis]